MSKFPRIILVFAKVDWPIFMRKRMLYALAGAARKYGSTVIAFNRPLCKFTTVIRKPQRMQEFFEQPGLEQLDANLYLYSPRYFIHDIIAARSAFLENLNLKALRKSYSDMSRRLGIQEENPLVWFYHPIQSYVTRLFNKSVSILEIVDSLTDFNGHENALTVQLEKSYRDKIDLLLTATPSSLEKYGRNYQNAWLSGNGLDLNTFEKLSRPELLPDTKLSALKTPRIGYTGNISDRLDWDLILQIAERKPDWNFVFVGSIDKSVPLMKTQKCKNIIFTGRVDHAEIPGMLKTFDVGIMPYKDNDFFRFSNPLKFYEFAAAGVRMISSNMEWLNNFPPDFVRIVRNEPKEWITAIADFLKSDRNSALIKGREIAGQYIWEDMSAKLLDKIAAAFFETA